MLNTRCNSICIALIDSSRAVGVTLSFYFVLLLFHFEYFYLLGEGSKAAESTANLIQNITLVRANSMYFGIKSTAKIH